MFASIWQSVAYEISYWGHVSYREWCLPTQFHLNSKIKLHLENTDLNSVFKKLLRLENLMNINCPWTFILGLLLSCKKAWVLQAKSEVPHFKQYSCYRLPICAKGWKRKKHILYYAKELSETVRMLMKYIFSLLLKNPV